MKFRPCIDIRNGQVVQIIGSTLNNQEKVNFVSPQKASFFSKMFRDSHLYGGHVIMLDNTPQTIEQGLKAISSFPGGLQIGGGINIDNAQNFLSAGASHLIISSMIFKDGSLSLSSLESLVRLVGKEKIVIDLSCCRKGSKYFAAVNKWSEITEFEINCVNLENLSLYCDEFLIHAIDVEGKREGIDEELVSFLGSCQNVNKITYAGGIRNYKDIEKIKTLCKGNLDYTIGSALDIFGGSLDLEKVINI